MYTYILLSIILLSIGFLILLIYFGTRLVKGLIQRFNTGQLKLDEDSFFSTMWLLAIAILFLFVSHKLLLLVSYLLDGGMH